ncbi:hypothetical protein [Arthrobacter sp. U41]|uniref:hypothetical protein n=1 Tax=Arthrobacter sp. U41 TaxID=1849032 RepID=UPI00085930B0|nr:hypothetical protein [Arthrobacter sp. U41]AOT02556.1 hypothetical protein ASPU41_03530 [Arthrobacter sp. U41]
MRTTTPDLTLTVTATDRASMDRELDEAVTAARERAMRERCRGILVTRHGPNCFTVELSETVPFGLTRERQEW